MPVSKKGGARPRSGRKPSPAHLKRGTRVVAMLTSDEYQALVEAAGVESISAYARRVLLRHLARRKK